MGRLLWFAAAAGAALCALAQGEENARMMQRDSPAGFAWATVPADNQNWTTCRLTVENRGRQLRIDEFGETRLDLPAEIDAQEACFLYLLLDLPSPSQLAVYFRGDAQEFSHERMALVSPPTYRAGMHAYRLPLEGFPGWQGQIAALRLEMGGLMTGSRVAFGGVAISEAPLESLSSPEGADIPVAPVTVMGPYKGERFVACSRTVVSMDELTGTPGLSTQERNPKDANEFGLNFDPQSQLALAKFVASVRIGGRWVSTSEADDVHVTPAPGLLTALCTFPSVALTIEAMALRPLSDTAAAEGAMLYRVKTQPPAPVRIESGGMMHMSVWNRVAWLRERRCANPEARVDPAGPNVSISNPGGIFYIVALRAAGAPIEPVVSPEGGYAAVEFDKGDGTVLAAFAETPKRAAELAAADPDAAARETLGYYQRILDQFQIATPVPEMDEAFRTAWLNMDYTWVKPYGCSESLHHWWALWQQYPSASFDWAGLTDRTRESILSHAERQYASGNIPYLLFFGERHLDFGGNNQTFMWQVQHYLKMTGDRDLARALLPPMRRMVDAFWRYEDPDGNEIPAFGVQVLTQEDYIATPRDGTSSAVVGVEMWRTLALVASLAGEDAESQTCLQRAEHAAKEWYARLWQHELGRPAYYVDQLEQRRPDGPYHTLVLPVVYDLIGPLDAYTSMRHLRDRLMGPQGELYYSNNFPNHISGVRSSPFGPTWGPQAGAYMQPWATRGLTRIGDRANAIRPLELVARWATMFPHRDAWPESSLEFTPAYFANTAANYAQMVIEALFGFQMDAPAGALHVQPAFPDDWDHAAIRLAPVEAAFTRNGGRFSYRINTAKPLRRLVRWSLPVCRVRDVRVNGAPATFQLIPGVNGLWLSLETPELTESAITFTAEPISWEIAHPGSIAEGDQMTAEARGCVINGIEDPTNVVSDARLAPDQASVTMSTNRLAKWLNYGRLGQLNFSRSTFFLDCEAQGQAFYAAVDFTLLPRYIAAPEPDLARNKDGYEAVATLRNNTSDGLEGSGHAVWAGGQRPIRLNIRPRSEQVLRIPTPREALANLVPGDNPLRLILPDGDTLDLECPVTAPFRVKGAAKALEPSLEVIPLPEERLMSDGNWKDFAAFPVFWQGPYNAFPNPMQAVAQGARLETVDIPGIVFPVAQGARIALVSHRLALPPLRIDVHRRLRTIYLVLLPFVENHDVFTECARIIVTSQINPAAPPLDPGEEPVPYTRSRYGKLIVQRSLYTPGDLDSWMPEHHAGPFATARLDRPDRFGLLTLLSPADADWREGVPLAGPYGMFALLEAPPRDKWPEGSFRSFPQPQYWACCPAIRTQTAIFNVVQVDLGGARNVESVEVSCPLQDAAVGVVSVIGIAAAPD